VVYSFTKHGKNDLNSHLKLLLIITPNLSRADIEKHKNRQSIQVFDEATGEYVIPSDTPRLDQL
jgi:hypothetical protein